MELTLDQALQQGIVAHKEGKLQDAERLYRAILQAQPNHPDANHNLGILAVAVGKPIEAIPLFKLALETNSQIEQFWLSYIDALIKAERFDEANRALVEGETSGVASEKLKLFHQQIQTSLSNDRKNNRQGLMVSEKRKRLAEKKKGKKRKAQGNSSGSAPSQHQISCLRGYYQAGRLEEAEELATLLTQQFPKYPFGWKVLGAVYKETGRLNESLLPTQESVKLSPQDAEAHYNLGVALQDLGKLDAAEASNRKAIALKSDYAEAHNNLGNTLKALGKLDEAEASYTHAIVMKPDFALAHYNLGVTLTELGRLDEAEASIRQAIVLKPDYAEAYSNLATIKKFSSEDDRFFQMQALYCDPTISQKNRCHICFALARASEDLEDLAAAFQFYAEGNALQKKQLGYDKAQYEKSYEMLKDSAPGIIANRLELENLSSEPKPIFIVGMPRSGTTLVEQIISSHPLVTGAGELPFVSQFGGLLAVDQTPVDGTALSAFRQQYLSALKKRSKGNAIVTDKMPQNFRFLGLITAALPEAKIIHVKRDPAAVCWANYTQNFVRDGLDYCYDLDDILHYHGLYQDLMAYWHQTFPHSIYELDYEVLTEHQEEETRKLINHLGLGWDDACLSPHDNTRRVATASNMQVRQKVYQGSSEKWKRYRPFLNGALDHLSVDNQ